MSMFVSVAVVLSGILFVICSEPGSIISYDTIQFPSINCDAVVCYSFLRVFSSLWCS